MRFPATVERTRTYGGAGWWRSDLPLYPIRSEPQAWHAIVKRVRAAPLSNVSDLIRKIDFFEPLDGRIVNKIARVCIPREYSPGDHVVRQGDPGLGLYFITAGRVRVEINRNGANSPVAELCGTEMTPLMGVKLANHCYDLMAIVEHWRNNSFI